MSTWVRPWQSRQTNTHHVQDWHKTAKGLATVPRDAHTHAHTYPNRHTYTQGEAKCQQCSRENVAWDSVSQYLQTPSHHIWVCDYKCVCEWFLHLRVHHGGLFESMYVFLCILMCAWGIFASMRVSRWAVCGTVHVNVQVFLAFMCVCWCSIAVYKVSSTA